VQLAGVIRGTGRVEAISSEESSMTLDRSATRLGKMGVHAAERDGRPWRSM